VSQVACFARQLPIWYVPEPGHALCQPNQTSIPIWVKLLFWTTSDEFVDTLFGLHKRQIASNKAICTNVPIQVDDPAIFLKTFNLFTQPGKLGWPDFEDCVKLSRSDN